VERLCVGTLLTCGSVCACIFVDRDMHAHFRRLMEFFFNLKNAVWKVVSFVGCNFLWKESG
jgi:hypothetical protein